MYIVSIFNVNLLKQILVALYCPWIFMYCVICNTLKYVYLFTRCVILSKSDSNQLMTHVETKYTNMLTQKKPISFTTVHNWMDHIRTAVKAILRGVEFQSIERRHRFRTRPGTLRQPTSPLPRDPSLWWSRSKTGSKFEFNGNESFTKEVRCRWLWGGGELPRGPKPVLSSCDWCCGTQLSLPLPLAPPLFCSGRAPALQWGVLGSLSPTYQPSNIDQPYSRFRSNNNLHKFEHRVEVV